MFACCTGPDHFRRLPHSAAEQYWLLGDDGQFAAEVGQSDVVDVNAVNQDRPPTALHQTEQDHAQRRLPCRETRRERETVRQIVLSRAPLQT